MSQSCEHVELMHAELERHGDTVVVVAVGEIDLNSAGRLQAQLRGLLGRDCLSVNVRKMNMARTLPAAAAIGFTLAVGGLVYMDGEVPSAFTTLFFIPIIFVAYRYPLNLALLIAGMASLFSSPAMEGAGVRLDASVMPVLWLGWPAVYLFLAVSLNQWTSLQQQRAKLETKLADRGW